MKDLVPHGGVDYKSAKKAAQDIANKIQKEVRLWFNVSKGGKPEKIKPQKNVV